MPDHPAPPGATPSRDLAPLDHREVFARFVDRLAARLPRGPVGERRPPQERTA